MFDLKSFRKELKLKQSDLADLFDVSQPRISAMEKTMEDLNPDQMKKLKNIFGENKVMEFYISEGYEEKLKKNFLHDPESPLEKMRQDYLGLVKDLMEMNKNLRSEINELSKEIRDLRKEIDLIKDKKEDTAETA